MQYMSTNLSTLGSRYTLIFDSGAQRLKHGMLGMFLEQTSSLLCGVKAPDVEESYLPFCDKENRFQAVYMSTTMNSASYQAINKEGGYNLTVTFTSPFCPGEEKMSTAPLFYVDVHIERNARPHNLVKVKHNIDQGVFVFGLQDKDLLIKPHQNHCDIEYEVKTSSRFVLGDFARTLNLKLYKEDGTEIPTVSCKERIYSFNGTCDEHGVFHIPFDLSQSGSFSCRFMFCTYSDVDNFISIYGKPHNFLYKSHFSSMDALTEYGAIHYDDIMRQSAFMDASIANSSLSQSWKDFIAFTFQSYKLNTIYSCGKDGDKAYNIWEGNCMYNSTMDVEFNNGLFYYTYFPEVLPTLLDQWAATENGEGYIDHDLGEGYIVAKAKYSYPMIVEENCNFIEMLYAYCVMKGEWNIAKKHYGALQQLVRYILDADTTGNGIPNTGTDNTIDDAVPSIQNAKEQTYLAIKSACTLQCFAQIASALSQEEDAETAQARAEKIVRSVDNELWAGDHYGVCTDKTQDGYWRFLTHETLSGPMEGKDSYSIYAENGLLYPMMTGMTPKYLDYQRLKQNIDISAQKCATQYGCNHSDDSDSIWFSQNLWRDFVAAYLGRDMLDHVDRYWEFQKIMNTGNKLNLYIDTFGENALWYYPRGLTSIGVLFAMLRLKIDGFKKEIYISPLRRSVRIPLVMFADWKNMRMPWVVERGDAIEIENRDLLKDYNIVIGQRP